MTKFGADTNSGYHGHLNTVWTGDYPADYIRFNLTVAAEREFKDFVVSPQEDLICLKQISG